jgi:hypothetical protein
MKKEVDYARKAVKTTLRNLSLETETQILLLSALAGEVWNLAWEKCEYWLSTETPEGEKKAITAFSLNYWLTEARKNEARSLLLNDPNNITLSDLSTDMCREVLRKLAGSYQSFFDLKKKKDWRARTPQQHKSGDFQTLSWSSVRLSKDKQSFIVPAMKGERLHIPLDEYLIREIVEKDRKVKHLTISRPKDLDAKGYVLSIVYAYDKPILSERPKMARAIDLGAGDVAVCDSTGQASIIPMRRPDKFWMKRIIELEPRIKSAVKGSRRHTKRSKARRKMHGKHRDQKIDYQRKLAHALVTTGDADVIIIGEAKVRLGLAKSSGTNKQHWGSQNTGYLDRLATYIEQKCVEYGKHFVKLKDPARQGDPRDPKMKLGSAKVLLREGCERFKIDVPDGAFTLRKFAVRQGKGTSPRQKVLV